jgi:hypothetical protein
MRMKGEFRACRNITDDFSCAMLQCGKVFEWRGFHANG